MAPDPHTVVAAAIDGPWRLDPLTERLVPLRGWRGPDEVGDVVALLLSRWRARPRGAPARVLAEVTALLAARPGVRHHLDDRPEPQWRWPVEPWTDLAGLASGLDLDVGELEWFADRGGWLHRSPDGPLHHYRRRWTASRSGVPRLLETPAPRLQELQRRVGRHVLAAIPLHDAAHGYVRGRSPVTLAGLHAGRPMVLCVDLEGFFSHVSGERIAGMLRAAGYPAPVAAALAGLLVTATPAAVLRAAPSATADLAWEPRRRLLDRLAGPHLPQGAPTSPAVANLLAYRLDRRLAGLATAVGAEYGRYADDLVLSGPASLPAAGLAKRVTQIAAEEGFRVRPDKTRTLPDHHRQRITGLVVNAGPAAARSDYDALRALLHNCARTGPDAQNRADHPAFREHLLGRISWVGTGRPARAARLRALFDAISW
ncbi:reverse transcriptase family protein [Pseudonocardia sp. GCM10023141]|uniref:reverse transcriptase family protein n=1 Tax=Pseudonocardia sp. GCM10023141 TaxID=3252653 RepID=UPI003609E2A7